MKKSIACLVLILTAVPASAQILLTANDSMGTSSFDSAGNWSDGNAPYDWETYFTQGYCLRTPSVAGNYTFARSSLTVGGGNGGGANPFLTNGQVNLNCLLNKTPSNPVITVSNLILDAGTIRDGMGTTDVWTLAGTISVTNNGGGLANQCRFNVDSVIDGSGTLYIADNGSNDPRRTIYWNSGANTYNGSIRLLGPSADRCRLTFSEGSRMNFAIGTNGINSSISGTGTATYNGVFNIDLTGAGVNLDDNWTLAAAAVQTFGSTFTVVGFDNAGSGFWTKMYQGVLYRFNQNTGKLRVMETLYSGSGTAEDPYQIWTPEQMNGLGMHAGMWASHIKLMANLDMSAFTGTQVNIIGKTSSFIGIFDGNGHVIRNLTIAASDQYTVGLFGIVGSGGQIRNLGVTKVNITGHQFVGGLVGYNSGAITSCYATGTVNGTIKVGGVLAYNYGTVINCFWDTQTSGMSWSDGGTGKTTAEMKTLLTFTSAAWDFVGESANGTADIWRMCVNSVDYPRLSWEFSRNGDFACPRGVALDDLLYLAGRWLGSTPDTAGAADANADGKVDLQDFTLFASHWLEGV